MVKIMNKNIKLLLDTLGKEPNWKTNDNAYKLFKSKLNDGVFDNFYKEEYVKGHVSEASTLSVNDIGYCEEGKFTLYAHEHCDEYTWVNFFIAVFDDDKNFVIGDFEKAVVASNKKHFDTLLKHVNLQDWCYWDI